MRRLAQSTAYTVKMQVFLASDHVAPATGKTVAVTIQKGTSAFSNPNAGATNATELSGGWYYVALDTTDTGTLGDLIIVGTATACDVSSQVMQVISATTGGLTNLDATVSSRASQTSVDDLPTNAELATSQAAADDATLAVIATLQGNITTILGLIDTEIAAILADTNELQTDWVNGGRLDLIIDAINAKTTNLPSDPADASVVAGLIAAAEAKIDTVDTVVDAIKLKTDGLPSDPADESLIIAATDALATLIGDVPTNAELTTALGTADDAVLSAIAALNNITAASVWAAATRTLTASTNLGDLDDAVLAAIAALNNVSVPQMLTTQMTESYAADGVAPTLAQALFLIQQKISEFSIAGTTLTVKKIDGLTTAATFTLSDATNPTGIARAT